MTTTSAASKTSPSFKLKLTVSQDTKTAFSTILNFSKTASLVLPFLSRSKHMLKVFALSP